MKGAGPKLLHLRLDVLKPFPRVRDQRGQLRRVHGVRLRDSNRPLHFCTVMLLAPQDAKCRRKLRAAGPFLRCRWRRCGAAGLSINRVGTDGQRITTRN